MKSKLKTVLSMALCFTILFSSGFNVLAADGSYSITDKDYPDLKTATITLTADSDLTPGNFLFLNITGDNGEDLTYRFISKLKDADTGEDLTGYNITDYAYSISNKPFLISSSMTGRTVCCEVYGIDRDGQEITKESNPITIPEFGDSSYNIQTDYFDSDKYYITASLFKNGEGIKGYGAEWSVMYKDESLNKQSIYKTISDNNEATEYSISLTELQINGDECCDSFIKIYTTPDKSEYVISDIVYIYNYELTDITFKSKIMAGSTLNYETTVSSVFEDADLYNKNALNSYDNENNKCDCYYYIDNKLVGYYSGLYSESDFKIPEDSEGKEFKIIVISRNRVSEEYVVSGLYEHVSEAGVASATAIIEAYQEPITPSVEIGGKPVPGSTLTPILNQKYMEANSNLNEDDFEYLWIINDGQKMVSGKTYEVQPEDVGSYILVSVDIKDPDGNGVDSVTSEEVLISDKAVTISGSTNIGDTVTATVDGEFTEEEEKAFVYTWYTDSDVEIEGAENTKQMVITEDIKKQIEGKNVYCVLNNKYISNEISVPKSNENIKLVVTNEDTGETPSSVKAGDTLVADITEYDVLPDDIYYMWAVEDDKSLLGMGKTITITDELIQDCELNGRKIYCIAESNTDEEFKLSSEMILVKATDKTETNSAECNVIVSQGQSFSVTIPAFISMNGEKNVTNEADFYTVVVADIAGGDTIEVKPVKLNIVLSQAGKKDLEAEISTEDGWNYEISKDGVSEDDLSSGVKRNHKISVAKLSAGRWIGTFNWSIITTGEKIKDSEEYVEYRQFDSATNEWKDLGRQ